MRQRVDDICEDLAPRQTDTKASAARRITTRLPVRRPYSMDWQE